MKKMFVFGVISLFILSIVLTGCETTGEAYYSMSSNKCQTWAQKCNNGNQQACNYLNKRCMNFATKQDVMKALTSCQGVSSNYNNVPGNCVDACNRWGKDTGKSYYCLSAEIELDYNGNKDPNFGMETDCRNEIFGQGRHNCKCCLTP